MKQPPADPFETLSRVTLRDAYGDPPWPHQVYVEHTSRLIGDTLIDRWLFPFENRSPYAQAAWGLVSFTLGLPVTLGLLLAEAFAELRASAAGVARGPSMRPLIARPTNEFGVPAEPLVRIIGIEVRVRSGYGATEEIALLPLDIELPEHPANRWVLPCTLHTSRGDYAFEVYI